MMAVHTAVIAAVFLCGPALAWLALTGRPNEILALAALALPPAVWAGRVLNGRECILQTWARSLRGMERSEGWARDMYWLPERWAMRVVVMGAALYLPGLAVWGVVQLQLGV